MKKLSPTIIIAFIIYFVDALCLTQGVIVFLVLLYVLFFLVPISLFALKKNRDIFRYRATKASVYFLAAIAIFGTNHLNNKIARHRAENIISSIKEFKSEYQRYPDKLDELVPEFLPSVPLAKYTLGDNKFRYTASQEERRHLLIMPLTNMRYYNFEEDKWGVAD
jgi:hypothetical protein